MTNKFLTVLLTEFENANSTVFFISGTQKLVTMKREIQCKEIVLDL